MRGELNLVLKVPLRLRGLLEKCLHLLVKFGFVLFQLRREFFAQGLHRTLFQRLKFALFKFQIRFSLSEQLVFYLEHLLDIQELGHDGVIKLE